MAGRALITDD